MNTHRTPIVSVLIMCFVAHALFVSFAPSVEAGMVYGRVYLDEEPQGQKELTLSSETGDSVTLQTDPQGNYRIVLPPGKYKVNLTGETKTAEVLSYPVPLLQNIRFK